MENRLKALQHHGQSVWLDYIRRSLITSGELERLIDDDGLRGVTSNPAIFEKAVTGSGDYHDMLASPAARAFDAKGLYERIAVRDIRDAADRLLPVYRETMRRDGYVSLEVSPKLAHDTRGTHEEAWRLWKAVSRPNVMIKVPATPEGIPVIRQLIDEGVNVNVTLLFSQETYEQVADAYLAGLEQRAASNGALEGVASVASFFISRIDSAVDALITERLGRATNARQRALLRSLQGKVAIANAKVTYQRYRELFNGPRWRALARRGAQTQRLLWASTGTKDASYRDVRYVEELIGPDTVNTMPPATLAAFRDHGRPRASLWEDLEGAFDVLATLADAGISLQQVTDKLLAEGVQLFSDAFDKLLNAVGKRAGKASAAKINQQTSHSARAARIGRPGGHRGLANARQGRQALGARCVALDGCRRGTVARVARHHQRPDRTHRTAQEHRGGGEERGLFRRIAARHGWVESRTGSHEDDFREDRRFSGAAHPRFHGSDADQGR